MPSFCSIEKCLYGVLLAAESTAVMLPFISGALRNNHNMYEAAGNNMLVMRNGVIGLGGAHVAAYHGMLCCLVGWDVVTYTTADVLTISAGFHPAGVGDLSAVASIGSCGVERATHARPLALRGYSNARPRTRVAHAPARPQSSNTQPRTSATPRRLAHGTRRAHTGVHTATPLSTLITCRRADCPDVLHYPDALHCAGAPMLELPFLAGSMLATPILFTLIRSGASVAELRLTRLSVS